MRGRGILARLVLASLALPFVTSCFSRHVEPVESAPVTRPPDPPVRPIEPVPTDPAPADPTTGVAPLVRIALRVGAQGMPLIASGAWRLIDGQGGVLVRSRARENWAIERQGRRLRAVRSDGVATGWQSRPLVQYPDDAGHPMVGGKFYRGAIAFVATDSGVLAVNHLPIEEYLRGVVPIEIGERGPAEHAAVEAQAIAARSYTITRIVTARAGNGRSPDFDLIASVGDQVYGGISAERPVANAAVRATTGLVLRIGARVVTAPFYSTCGGETAAAEEVWRTDGEPHLRRVSDRVPGSERFYCDIAPRFAWTRVLTARELDDAVRRYLAAYATVPSGGPGRVLALSVDGRTPSGRVAQLLIRTEKGSYSVRGNEARQVLRTASGEPLNSSYFSVNSESSAGRLVRAIFRGNGYGHGVGMCQWGAIGRARAGFDVRAILRTYYPGTIIGAIPPGILTP